MTNYSDSSGPKKSNQKVPLIPPASIRTGRTPNSNSTSSKPTRNHLEQGNNLTCRSEQSNGEGMKTSNKVNTPALSPETWCSVEDLFWDHMKEVQNKWSTLKLNDDIWAKLIYFERNRRLAKAYVSAPVLTVDGSTHGLDGFRIGLSGIDNMYRSLESIGCLRSISQGIKLKIDNRGNILIRKIGPQTKPPASNASAQCSVWVKDWPSTADSRPNAPLNENCMMREIEKSDISYKLFDMRKFRLQLEKLRSNNDNDMLDWRQCVSIISFVRATTIGNEKQTPKPTTLLEDPCWLMIINIIAIDMLKSTICDRNSPSKQGSASLIKNHSLLESRNNLFRNSGNSNNNSRLQKRAPVINSSSASTLFPSTISSSTTNQVEDFPNNTDELGNNTTSMADNERIKKLRTANNRYRPAPGKSGSPNYRRYQSTLQLSSAASNNTIYTTFNSKFINSKSYTDNSSTSDYNSASRSTSSCNNYWYSSNQPLYPVDSLQHYAPSRLRYPEEGRAFVTRRSFMPPHFENNDKSLSLSTFDLSQRRLDIRSMKSSIKMNYDHLSETDDYTFEQLPSLSNKKSSKNSGSQPQPAHDKQNFESDLVGRQPVTQSNDHAISHPKLATESELAKTSESISCCCEDLTDIRKNGSSSRHVNHDHASENPACCRPLHNGKILTETGDKGCQQKVSKSSIASSSSSSGCADNDYFMSHSSSSMSSSTASNERELLSQPASSSGIVCSGSTSDEYEERKPLQTKNRTSNGVGSESSSPKSSNSVGKISKSAINSIDNHCSLKQAIAPQNNRRGYREKTIEPPGFCCELTALRNCNEIGETSCNCPPVELECSCCCDCFQPEVSTIDSPVTNGSCRCEDESIYGRLPHPPRASAISKMKTRRATSEKAIPNESRKGNGIRASGKVSPTSDDFENISTIPMQSDNVKSTMTKLDENPKQASSWLEKRKYSRILPRFMFSSSSSSSRQVARENKSTQRKSNTMDKDEKFKLFRSNQDLSYAKERHP